MTREDCEVLRREIKAIADRVWALRSGRVRATEVVAALTDDEAYQNATLAYRKLEDAAMRLGKAIQALDGGTSVYDKTQVPGAS